MKRLHAQIFGLALLLLLTLPGVGNAGIIVTEGKSNVCSKALRKVRALSLFGALKIGAPSCPGAAKSSSEEEERSSGTSHDVEGDEDLDLDDEGLDDLDTTPEGYVCTDLGGGVELCEPTTGSEATSEDDEDEGSESESEAGQGAGPGSAQGGAWLAMTPEDSPAEESVEGGCSGGPAGDPSGPLTLLFMLGSALLTRRRA